MSSWGSTFVTIIFQKVKAVGIRSLAFTGFLYLTLDFSTLPLNSAARMYHQKSTFEVTFSKYVISPLFGSSKKLAKSSAKILNWRPSTNPGHKYDFTNSKMIEFDNIGHDNFQSWIIKCQKPCF